MKIFVALMVGVSALLLSTSASYAKGWRGITPLHSTREDANRLLGSPTKGYYELKDEIAVLRFSGGSCENDGPFSWKVAAGTVTEILVIPKTEPLVSSLGIDEQRYKRVEDWSIKEHIFFVNKEEGESIETFAGKVKSMTFSPQANEANLRCWESCEQWTAATGIFCEGLIGKFDEFSDISSQDEKARVDNAAEQLKRERPDIRIFMIVYGGRNGRDRDADKRAARIKGYLKSKHRISEGRILIVKGGYRERSMVEIWLLPVGMSLPGISPD